MRSKDHGNSEDDRHLWEAVTTHVNPLKSLRYSGLMEKLADSKTYVPRSKENGKINPAEKGISPIPIEKVMPIDLREGDHAGLNKTTRRKLFRGNLPIEARLDLHGFNAQQAETRLRAFIQQSASLGHRCVLVITGKGVRGEGILRRHVPFWLKQPPLVGTILAISNAAPKDGGAGAIYVLLRRLRSSK